MPGWISLYRDLLNNFLWEDKPFTYGQAWVDILLNAQSKDNKFLLRHEMVEAKKGSFVTSSKQLMERWGWSNTKVRNFLELLENENMIERKTDNKKTTINVVNWGKYQNPEIAENFQKTFKNTAEKFQNTTNNKDNKENKENKINIGAFKKPTSEEVKQFCIENNINNVDADCFINYYESNGWMVGSHKMKDWKATVRNWNKRSTETRGAKNEITEQRTKTEYKGYTAW